MSEDAVDELRKLANGRGDLLAKEAGLMTGSASVWPVTADYLAAIELLVQAGRRRHRAARLLD